MIRVLVAEDSITVQELLVALLDDDPEIEVVGTAKNGVEAVRLTGELLPDLITMDIQMPLMDGFRATKEIMIEQPTPIVIVTGRGDVREMTVSMQALSAGALAVLPKMKGPGSPAFEQQRSELLDTVKRMSQVKVVRHWRERAATPVPVGRIPRPARGVQREVVAIAISTGGPAALHQLLTGMPRDFPAPILVVQHITRGFVVGLVKWLDTVATLRVKVAEEAEPMEPGTVYLAPDDKHMGANRINGGQISLVDGPPIGGFRPAGTYLFRSVAAAFGRAAVAVIMTGMGDDGVAGLEDVRKAGGRIVAQDEATSVVYGMPGAAVNAGLADVVLPLASIVEQLSHQVYDE